MYTVRKLVQLPLMRMRPQTARIATAFTHSTSHRMQELGRASLPAVRNNIVVALSDLVIRHTALIDAHVPRLAAAVSDPHELVRTQVAGPGNSNVQRIWCTS